ncbi:MAG TPA: uroporphyrinogen-III C-methyltransferase [Candidatus Binatia bacterium]|nr:uroporphyrinogen-III C-methyltransferase [Candidatus Binatia bacterium]
MRSGKVYLVGAGPGDPGLLTVRGLQLLHRAHVVVYDQLVNPVLLEEAPPVSIKIFVGKEAGRHCIGQKEINQILIDHARLGYKVVRLKGGDPFVFGRGGEEAEALADAGIPFEIVPGVSSAIAVPAYAGIPLTHRKFASSFAVVTGHGANDTTSRVEWDKLATAVDTLVILMGLKKLPHITAELRRCGLAPEIPVAVVRWGTTVAQEAVIGTLADIVDKAAYLESPAVIVVGRVVEMNQRLDWFVPITELTKQIGVAGAYSRSL